MDVMTHFSRNLKSLRERAGLNQSQLADKLDVSRGSISFYENKDRIPDVVFLYKVSEYFGVSTDWLLGLHESPSMSVEDQAITERLGLSALSIDILEQVHSYSNELADVLNLLIEEEFPIHALWETTLDEHDSALQKHRKEVFGNIEEQIANEIKKHPEWSDTKRKGFEGEVKAQIIGDWSLKYYEPILSRIYNYLVKWKKADGENCYITPDGKITFTGPLDMLKEGKSFMDMGEDKPNMIPIKSDELVEYALLMDIQDRLRILKAKRAGELGPYFD